MLVTWVTLFNCFLLNIQMACRRMLTKQGTILRRWYHPSLSHIFHRGDESDENFKPCPSQPGGIRNSVSETPYGNSIGGNRRFGALCGQSKCLPAFFLPPAVGVGTSFSRHMSSATGEGSENFDRIGDIADILSDGTVEVVSLQAPAINEVAVAAADSALPVAALQHLIDGVHSFTGLNWYSLLFLIILFAVKLVP